MKKAMRYITVFMVLLCIVGCGFLLKSVVLWEGAYFDSKLLSQEENKEIKAVLLDAVRDRCSSLYKLNAGDIYDHNSEQQIIQFDAQTQAPKSWFSLINPNFMGTVTKTENGRYHVTVKMHYPEAYYYCFEVGVIEGRYLITSFQIDI